MWRTGRLRKVEAVVIAPIRNTVRRRRDGNSGAIGYKQYTVNSKLIDYKQYTEDAKLN